MASTHHVVKVSSKESLELLVSSLPGVLSYTSVVDLVLMVLHQCGLKHKEGVPDPK